MYPQASGYCNLFIVAFFNAITVLEMWGYAGYAGYAGLH
jgi:hypothetical protein